MAKLSSRFRGTALPIRLCLVLNVCIWVFAWADLGRHAVHYPANYKVYEGAYPQLIFNWGLTPPGRSPESYLGGKVAFFANLIPWVVVNATFNLLLPVSRFPGRYMGTTVYGYQNIAWVLVSFAQWYLIGWIIQKLGSKWFDLPDTPLADTPPTTTIR